jgi:hypothetical protein
LSRAAKALRAWSKLLVPQGKVAMAVCREVNDKLERAQERRQVTAGECDLIRQLKHRIMGLAVVEKSSVKTKIKDYLS